MENIEIDYGWVDKNLKPTSTRVVGIVHKIGQVLKVGTKETLKRDIIIDASSEYNGKIFSSYITITGINKAIDCTDELSVGDTVCALVSVGANSIVQVKGEDAAFNNINFGNNGIKILKKANAATKAQPAENTESNDAPPF